MGLNANVLNNTLEFLRRVEMKGLEAFAFVEAYTAVQNEHALAQNPFLAQVAQAQTSPPAPPAPEPVAVRSTQKPAPEPVAVISTQKPKL